MLLLKEKPESSVWFKDHKNVFTNPTQLGSYGISTSDEQEKQFISKVYNPYIQSVIDCVSFRLESSEVYCAFSLFDPRHLPTREDQLDTYGQEILQTSLISMGKSKKSPLEANQLFQSL